MTGQEPQKIIRFEDAETRAFRFLALITQRPFVCIVEAEDDTIRIFTNTDRTKLPELLMEALEGAFSEKE